MSQPLHITEIEIRNILGIRYLKFSAGSFNTISGQNGSGKSSILQAIEGTLGGGARADLIREGSDTGETVFVLNNGSRIHATFGRDGKTTRQLETPDGVPIKRPTISAYLGERLNPASFNPVDFLSASPKEQIDQLMRVSKLHLATSEYLEAIAECEVPESLLLDKDKTPELPDPLRMLAMARQSIYDWRHGLNAIVKEKDGLIASLSRTLPPLMEDPADPAEVRAELERERDGMLMRAADLRDAVGRKKLEVLEKSRSAEGDLRAIREAAIAKANKEFEDGLSAVNDSKQEALNELNAAEKAGVEANYFEAKPRLDALQKKLDVAEIEIRDYERAQKTAQDIRSADKDRARYKAKSMRATEVIELLDALKLKVMQALPVPGLEIHGNDLRFNGILLATQNTATRTRVALELAVASANPLMPIIQCDGIEALDSDSWAAIQQWAAEHPQVQFFMARVEDNQQLRVDATK